MSSSMGETGATQSGAAALGYETRDANPNAVLAFLACLFLVICLTMVASWLMFRHFSVSEVAPPSPSPFADARQLPAGPELLPDPRKSLLQTLATQRQELDSYAWEDRKAGVVRIPIQRAMDLLLQKGLPVLPTAAEQESAPEKSVAVSRRVAGANAANQKGRAGDD